jgi:hypothetical protein
MRPLCQIFSVALIMPDYIKDLRNDQFRCMRSSR